MTITVQHLANSVALVTLSAHASRNAFSLDSMKSMSDIFDDLLSDPSIRSIVHLHLRLRMVVSLKWLVV